MSTRTSLWHDAPEAVLLERDEVHVWRSDLEQPQSTIQRLLNILSSDERSRAERFHYRKDRDAFIVARAVLRLILSRYLHLSPERLCFGYGHYGKPVLKAEAGMAALRFNVSHSHGLALYALVENREVGIDLEFMRDEVASEQIAEQFFSPREVAMLRSLPAHQQTEGFFNCWTRKEAYIKARGEGLSLPLDQFDVSLIPGEAAALLSSLEKPQEARCWSLRELRPGPGYVAAVAVEGEPFGRLCCWQWSAKHI